VGEDHFFLFGLTTEEVQARKAAGYDPKEEIAKDAELKAALDAIASGVFARGDAGVLQPIVDSLTGEDTYLLCADYRSYIDAQDRIDAAYQDQDAWTRSSILNAARCGFFSSDRTMREYAEGIWQVEALEVPER
jgi:starch phosphorylase